MTWPTGTVTFLFTDIERSTRLLRRLGDRYVAVLEDHNRLLRAAFSAHSGMVFGREGDALFAVFRTAGDAVRAALSAQRSVAGHAWPDGEDVRIRIGVHTGEAILTEDDYVGLAVHETSRICHAGHGGQLLLSSVTAGIVEDQLPQSTFLLDLGEHQLKDLERPQRLFQLSDPELRIAFPALRTISAIPNNLPAPVTSFVGRERETLEIAELLSTGNRIVTLLGPGGSGKTRLALHVATEIRADFPDGVWLVELAGIGEVEQVPRAVAEALRLREAGTQPLVETIVERLRSTRLLVVLDNCEHVVLGAARMVEALTRGCPHVQVLATSREALVVQGEAVFPVSPLSLPRSSDVPDEIDITEYEAIQLFVDRARSANPRFALSRESATPLAEVCQRLDGLPLAIELAAARTAVLTVAQINERLDDRFHLLTLGSRTALPRQQTLRALVDWSYDLLEAHERILLSRLSVFVAGFTLEAAEAVGAGNVVRPAEVLDLLSALVRKSLVSIDERQEQPRYRMLETIRQYALERLSEGGQEACVRLAHRRWCVEFASRGEPLHLTSQGPEWHDRLDSEYPNLRAAWQSALEDPDGTEDALRLCVSLGLFFWLRSHITEGRAWVEATLARADGAPRLLRAKAFLLLGELAFAHLDLDVSTPAFEASLALARSLSEEMLAAWALTFLGATSAMRGDRARGRAQLEEAREIGERFHGPELAGLYYTIGSAASLDGDQEAARRYLQLAVTTARDQNVPYILARFLPVVASKALDSGHEAEARLRLAEALEVARATHDPVGVARSLTFLAEVDISHGEFDAARARLDEAAPIVSRESEEPATTTRVRLALARLQRLQGHFDASQASLDQALMAARRLGRDKELADVYQAIGDLAVDRGDDHGAELAYEQGVQLARRAEQPGRIARALRSLGELAVRQGRRQEGRAALSESLGLSRQLAVEAQVASSLSALGVCALAEGQIAEARHLLGQALVSRIKLSHRVDAAATLESLGEAHVVAAAPGPAAFAFGVADELRRALGAPAPPARVAALDQAVAAARSLDPAVFEVRWGEGRRARFLDVPGALGLSHEG